MLRTAMIQALMMLLPLASAAAEGPDALTVREAGRHFFSGEQVVRTVLVDPALAGPAPRTLLRWRMSVGPALVRSEAVAVPADAARDGMAITLPMPLVQRVTGGRLDLALERDGAALGSGGFDFQLFPPRPEAPPALQGKKIVLLDPTGRTAAALDYLSVQYEELAATWTAVSGAADMFLVGGSIPADELARFLTSVQSRAAEGAVCVVLEQNGLDPNKFPWLALAPADGGWEASDGPECPDPVRGELAPEALRGWRDGGSVIRPFRTPVRGNFTLVLDAVPGAQGPPQTAVLELPYGKGRYLFCQLSIADGFLEEPAARYALANLLRYAATMAPHAPVARAAVLADPAEEDFARGFTPLGLKAEVNPPSLEGCGVVIVYGSEASARAFRERKAARSQALRDMVDAGAKLVLLDLRPETVDVFRSLWDGDLELAEPGRVDEKDFSALWDKPLLRGARPAELEALCRRADFPAITYRDRHDPAPSTAPGIMAVAQGKGAVIFCQLPLPKDEADEVALRAYSQLFTNLNITLEDPSRRDAQ